MSESGKSSSEKRRRYHPSAYHFVRQALDQALTGLEHRRHISGQELLKSIACLARKRFGPYAPLVFEEWGIHETYDFGRIVFDMVEGGIMSKRPEDSIEDFRDGFDIQSEFEENYDYLSEIRNTWSVKTPSK